MLKRRLMGLVAAVAGLANAVVIANAADDRPMKMVRQYVAECAAPKAREYKSYGNAILDHRPAVPVSPLSDYCVNLYQATRYFIPSLPTTPPKQYEQYFAEYVSVTEEINQKCSKSSILEILKKGGDDSYETWRKNCDALFNSWDQAKRDFDSAKQDSDQFAHMLMQQGEPQQ